MKVLKDKTDPLKGFVVMGQPDPSQSFLYLTDAEINDFGTSCEYTAFFELEHVHIFKTEPEAIAIKTLLEGTLTQLDYDVLCFIGNHPGKTLVQLNKDFPRKPIAESISKFLRNKNVDIDKAGHLFINNNGKGTARRFKYGDNCMSATPYKVKSVESILKELEAKAIKIKQGTKLF